ncbi:hypothetical protein [Streptomyces sp. NPDC056061]
MVAASGNATMAAMLEGLRNRG